MDLPKWLPYREFVCISVSETAGTMQEFVLSCIAHRGQDSLSTQQPKQSDQSVVGSEKQETVDLDKFITSGTTNNTMIRLDRDLVYTPVRCSKTKLRGSNLRITGSYISTDIL